MHRSLPHLVCAMALLLIAPPAAHAVKQVFLLKLNFQSRIGCSRSYQSTLTTGSVVLTLSDWTARLFVNLQKTETTGPSLGSFRQGQRNFTRRTWTDTRRYLGVVRRVGRSWHAELQQCSGKAWTGCVSPQPLKLSCSEEPVKTYPLKQLGNYLSAGEIQRPVTLLVCRPLNTPSPKLQPLLRGNTLLLKRHTAVEWYHRRGRLMWAGQHADFLRAPLR